MTIADPSHEQELEVHFKFISRTAAAIFLCTIATVSQSQESPDNVALSALVKAELPPFWTIEGFKVVATSDSGDAVTPRRAFRFEAEGSPTDALFAETAQEGPFSLVLPTMESDATRTIYGVLDLGYKAGKWSGVVNIENPVGGLGQPRDLFERPALVLGSDETEQKLATMRSSAVESAVSAIEREIAQLQSNFEAQIAQMKQEQAEEITRVQADYRTRLAELSAENEPLLAEARAEREKLIATQKETTRAALAALTSEAEAQSEKLKEEHAAKRGQLIEKQRQELAAIETRLATEMASLKNQLNTSEELILLQQELRSSLAKRNLGSKELFQEFEKGVIERTAFLASIPKAWAGTVTCTKTSDATVGASGFNLSYPLYMRIDKVRSNGATVFIGNRQDYLREGKAASSETNLTWVNDVSAFPLEFNLVSRESIDIGQFRIRYNLPLSLTQDGKFKGSGWHQIGRGSQSERVNCALEFSS